MLQAHKVLFLGWAAGQGVLAVFDNFATNRVIPPSVLTQAEARLAALMKQEEEQSAQLPASAHH